MDLLKTILDSWNSLSAEAKIAVAGIIVTIIGIIVTLRKRKPTVVVTSLKDTYRLISRIEDLYTEAEVLSATLGEVEPYIERESLVSQLQKHLTPSIPGTVRLLIHGRPRVGKTREAIHIIDELNKHRPTNIYFSKGPVEIPFGRLKRRRNLVLFIDDLKVDCESEFRIEGGEHKESLSQLLSKTIRFFKEVDENVDVILTMKTEEYKKLTSEISDVIEEHNFVVVELEEPSLQERKTYIQNLVELFEFKPLRNDYLVAVAQAGTELGEIYRFFWSLYIKPKKQLGSKDIEQFVKDRKKKMETELSRKRTAAERSIVEMLSKLVQFWIPTYSYVIVELCTYNKGGFLKFLARRDFRKAMSSLDGCWFRIKEGRVYCHESTLLLRDKKDPKIRSDLELINQGFASIYNKLKPKDIYPTLRPLSEALHNHGRYQDSIMFIDKILSLPNKAFPKKVRSRFIFFKGYNFYSLGWNYWDQAEHFYRQSIEVDGQNLFAKHALTTLCYKENRVSEALKILDEIIETNDKDLLAYKTRFEILMDIDPRKAVETCKRIENLFRSVSFPPRLEYSAKFALTRFSAKKGKMLRKEGKFAEAKEYFNKTVIPKFESLINEIPPEEYELKAIVQNAYGCLLWDINRKEEGISQLKNALKSWPEHVETLHKLASICLKINLEQLEQKENEIRSYLNKILGINASHHPAKRSLLILDGKLRRWAKSSSEREFWEEAHRIYREYQAILEPEKGYLNLDNLITHHAVGCFLASVDAIAFRKGFLKNRPTYLPTAEEEFRKSIDIGRYFDVIDELRQDVRHHLILGYITLGTHLAITASGNEKKFAEGIFYLKEGLKRRRMEASTNLRNIVKKWIKEGKRINKIVFLMYVYYYSAPQDLLAKFEIEIDRLPGNLDNVINKTLESLDIESSEHLSFVTLLVSAIQRRRILDSDKVRELITKSKKIPSLLNRAGVLELNIWKNIFYEMNLPKEAENCVDLILKRKPENEAELQIFISESLKRNKDKAFSLMEGLLE